MMHASGLPGSSLHSVAEVGLSAGVNDRTVIVSQASACELCTAQRGLIRRSTERFCNAIAAAASILPRLPGG
jgi:hypothetical protein